MVAREGLSQGRHNPKVLLDIAVAGHDSQCLCSHCAELCWELTWAQSEGSTRGKTGSKHGRTEEANNLDP